MTECFIPGPSTWLQEQKKYGWPPYFSRDPQGTLLGITRLLVSCFFFFFFFFFVNLCGCRYDGTKVLQCSPLGMLVSPWVWDDGCVHELLGPVYQGWRLSLTSEGDSPETIASCDSFPAVASSKGTKKVGAVGDDMF